MSKEANVSGGASGLTLLSLLFIGLKFTHYIDWSWKWVLSPVWIPAIIALAFLAFALVMALVTGQLKSR